MGKGEEKKEWDSDGNEDPEWSWVFAFPKTGRHVEDGGLVEQFLRIMPLDMLLTALFLYLFTG